MKLDYFYGNQAEQFSFYRIPKVLFTDERYKGISAESKILYGILLDRISLSQKNGWLDEANRVYIIFTVDEVKESMGCAEQKAVKLLSELENTIEKYLRDAKAFFAFVGEQIISKEVVIAFKQHLVDAQYAVSSINSMLASLNSLLVFLGLPECKAKNLRMQKQTYCAEDKELTKEEYLRLLEAAKGQPQLMLVMETICSTGIRVSELKYFTVEAVRRGEITISCKNKTRNIIVPGKLKKLLLDYAAKEKIKAGTIFITKGGKPLDRCNIWAQMKRLCDKARVKKSKVFPHNLRKLFARTFYGIEKDIAKLADILGHSSVNTTRIYIMSTGKEHRQKIEKLGLLI